MLIEDYAFKCSIENSIANVFTPYKLGVNADAMIKPKIVRNDNEGVYIG